MDVTVPPDDAPGGPEGPAGPRRFPVLAHAMIVTSETEEWRSVPSHPNYEASSLGRVRSVDRTVIYKDGRSRFWPSVVLTPNPKFRYHNVWLGNGAFKGAHVLVCETFHGPRPSKDHEVAHGNGNRRDNRPSNLRWATPKENKADAFLHGAAPRGITHGMAKLTEENVRSIRQLRRSLKLQSIADYFGISYGHAKGIIHRRTWKHIP